MKYVDHCILCSSKKVDIFFCDISRFISDRVGISFPFEMKFIHCKNCDFSFYNPRFDENEILLLYENYRDEKYQMQRNKYEKWYTKELNRFIGKSPVEIKNRKENLSGIIKGLIDVSNIKSVLDFGGDMGQFIPDEFANTERYVYDVSNTTPISGIKMIKDLSNIRHMKFDFIVCCHVLEHLSSPLEMLDKLKNFSRRGTFFYFEVPFDSPFYQKFGGNIIKAQIKKALLGLHLNNFLYLIFKFFGMHYGFLGMHEHVNFFSLKSIKHMLLSNGFDLCYIREKTIDVGWDKIEILSCLAKLK